MALRASGDELEEAFGAGLAGLLRAQVKREEEAAASLRALVLASRAAVREALAAMGGLSPSSALQLLEHLAAMAAHHLGAGLARELRKQTREMVPMGARAAIAPLGHLPMGGKPAEIPVPAALPSHVAAAVDAYHASLVTDVADDLRSAVTRAVRAGVLAGKSTDEVAKEIGLTGLSPTGPFRTAADRAEVIARTELNRVANMAADFALQDAAQKEPGLSKEWVSAGDDKVRPDHAKADGQRVPVNGSFLVAGFRAKHPCDPALPASQSVNCRCRCVAVRA